MYTGEGKGGPDPLGRKAVPHDTPFFFFLILNIIYFHLSDILIFLITLSLTMSAYHNEADIAVLKSKVKILEENQNIIFERIRTNERWIAGAGAVLVAGMSVLAIIAEVNGKTIKEVSKTEYESTRVFVER